MPLRVSYGTPDNVLLSSWPLMTLASALPVPLMASPPFRSDPTSVPMTN